MTKREEIRKGVAEFCRVMRVEGELRNTSPQEDAYDILDYLNDNGAVLKVDRELPDIETTPWSGDFNLGKWNSEVTRTWVKKSGYVAVEPLIEDEDSGKDKKVG